LPPRCGTDGGNGDSSPERYIGRMLSETSSASPVVADEILTASMVALCGLRCHENSMRLYESVFGIPPPGQGEAAARFDEPASPAVPSSMMYRYASLNQKRHGTSALGNPWASASLHIDQLAHAIELIRDIGPRTETKSSSSSSNNNNRGNGVPTERQREGLEEILARAMNSCTNAHQPELSLYLLEWMEDSVLGDRQTPKPAADIYDVVGSYGDSVTAETILALRWTRDLTGATKVFESILEKHAEDDLVRWRKTIVSGLAVMVASGRGSDAVKVFEVLDGDARSTASYTTIGRHLSKVKDWKELIDLYRDATAEGYSSEELGLLAMLAVTSTRVDNRLRILRAIVDDCAANVGVDSKRWTMTKYWQIKRMLGFYHARLLMWWNDEQRAPLDEVNLAIKEFYREQANGMRPKNDVVRAIVAGAGIHDSLGLEHTGGYDKVPRSEEHWAELLDEVLHAVGESSIRYDPNFVDSVVGSYKSLGRSRECVDYVSEVMNVDGTRLRRSTLTEAMEAAKAEQALGLYNEIEMMLLAPNGDPSLSQSAERYTHMVSEQNK